MDWHVHVQVMLPHVVRITTPDANGTGFLLRRDTHVASIMTAAHVVRNAVAWHQTVTVHHQAFPGGSVSFLADTSIALHPSRDSASLCFPLPMEWNGDLFPETPIELVQIGEGVRPGVEVGWLGYPGIVPGICFFSGCISAVQAGDRYFVDGIAVPGVSGGPAFYYDRAHETLRILGSISAYQRAGSDFPGLMVADDVSWAAALQQQPLAEEMPTPVGGEAGGRN